MNELMKDIIHTADNFIKNFTDNQIYPSIEPQPFNYSIESLEAVDKLLEEISDYVLDEDALHNTASMVGCYVFERARRNYGGEYLWKKRAAAGFDCRIARLSGLNPGMGKSEGPPC